MGKKKAKDKKHNVVYIAYSFSTNDLYIGVKSFNRWETFYRYQTSSSDGIFRNSEKMKHIIADFDTREEAMAYESELHKHFDVKSCDSFSNRANQNLNGYRFFNYGEKHHFVHFEGMQEYCYSCELESKYDIPRASMSGVVSGRCRQLHGWALKNSKFKDPWLHYRKKVKVYHFVHYDGTEEVCTPLDLARKYSLIVEVVRNLTSGRRNQANGWTLKHILNTIPRQELFSLYSAREEIHKFIRIDGLREHCTVVELAKKYDISKRFVCAVVNGTNKQCCGWALEGNVTDDTWKKFKHKVVVGVWIHDNGIVEECTQTELIEKYPEMELKNNYLTNVRTGKISNTHGWSFLHETGFKF